MTKIGVKIQIQYFITI